MLWVSAQRQIRADYSGAASQVNAPGLAAPPAAGQRAWSSSPLRVGKSARLLASYNHLLMQLPLRSLRFRLAAAGLLPTTRLARFASYLLALDLFLFLLHTVLNLLRASYGQSLRIWVILLSCVVSVLFSAVGIRWTKARLLWRLRHRLIVTYVFIGVIPAVLLILMAFIPMGLADSLPTSWLHPS